jgi:hypothetical protein
VREKIQRLFGNPYPPRRGPFRRARPAVVPVHPMTIAPWIALTVVGLAALVALPAPALAGSPPAVVAVGPWSSYDTGREEIILAAPLPMVELRQDANGSADAILALEHVDEISTGPGSHPIVVASASPVQATLFNVSEDRGTISWPLSMGAQLQVVTTGEPLWSPANGTNGTTLSVGSTTLTVEISLWGDPSDAQGVTVDWNVANWPWRSTSDLLGMEFQLTARNSSLFQTCSYSDVPVSLTNCSGLSLATGSAVWGSDLGAVRSSNGAGPLAVVAWPSTLGDGDNHTLPIECGAYAQTGGVDRFVVAAAEGGGSIESGSTDFYLAAPLLPLGLPTIHGEPLTFGATVAGAVAVVAASWTMYRRRERRLIDSL